jgi:iron complex transport system substrate-binding protein
MLLDGLSIEHILAENPDYIFISAMGNEDTVRAYFDTVLESPLWQELSAVKEDRYYYLPKELSQYKPNAEWYEAYLLLWEIIYGQS